MTRAEFDAFRGDVVAHAEIVVLVERARNGDTGAWEELFRMLYPRLVAYAGRQLDPEGARAAVSEAMARAVSRIGCFEWKGAGFEGWLFSILRRVVTERCRQGSMAKAPAPALVGAARTGALRAGAPRAGALRAGALRGDTTPATLLASVHWSAGAQQVVADPDPNTSLPLGEHARKLRIAFRGLRPKDQELLYLRVVAGLSCDDVGAVLSRRPSAVRLAQARALERLRRCLESGDR